MRAKRAATATKTMRRCRWPGPSVFADLVSYTALSRRMNEKTLAQLVQRFENKCAEIISVGGGRLIKTIGDEVLYTAETPVAGAEISLALAQAFDDDELLPQARVSMVWGRILSRLGDIYGPTVNLAARLTALRSPARCWSTTSRRLRWPTTTDTCASPCRSRTSAVSATSDRFCSAVAAAPVWSWTELPAPGGVPGRRTGRWGVVPIAPNVPLGADW
jgi:class 3 adenylate cyclase